MQFRKKERIIHLTPAENLIGDISETGACINLGKAPKEGTIFKLKLFTKTIETTVSSKVIHVKQIEESKFQAGVEFISLTKEDKNIIIEMVDDYSKGVTIDGQIVS